MYSRKEIFKFAENQYGTTPDYPWAVHLEYAVLRHQDGKKWYCLIMNVPGEKIGLQREREFEIMDIKCNPSQIGNLRRSPGFLPAYHMNKEHWLTVLLDGSMPKKEIEMLIAQSYELTK